MLCVFPEVSELNEFEKIIKNTNFQNNYDKKRAVEDYKNLKKLRDSIEEHLPEGHKDYDWLNKISNGALVDMFKSQELLRNIIIFMNAGIRNLVEEEQQ